MRCGRSPGRVPGGGNMAFRRVGLACYDGFDPSLGRVNGRLIGGEENDLFERLLRGGETIWYVPGAVMWHIIPPSKLTADYFRRLSYNVGVSQRRGASAADCSAGRKRLFERFRYGISKRFKKRDISIKFAYSK